jgi:PKD repeat protein
MIPGYDASHGNPQINYATNNYFNPAHGFYSWTYLDPNNTEAIAGAPMRSKLYIGMGYANYTAHCDWDRWGTPSFTTANVASMNNANKYGLMIGNCCLSNKFNATGGPCLGEVLLRTPNKGAVGYIGGSNNTLWNEDYWWGIGVTSTIQASPTYATTGLGAYDCVFHDHGEPYADWFVTNSQMVYAGNRAVQASTTTQKKYYWEIYHLMGDPSVMNYMSQPPALSMSYTAPIMVGDVSLVVTCEPYTLVALSQNNILLDSEFSGANSSVTLNFPAFTSPGTALIVGTKQNRSPHIQTIDIEEASIPIDAQVMEIQNIETSYPCDGVEITPVLVIRNKGINNLTQVTVNYRWDSGTTQQINWNGNLVTNATDQIPIPAYMLTTGNHILRAWTSNPNGMIDGNIANDSSDVAFTVEDLPIVADFAANITEFCTAPAEVSFTNSSSNANTYSWDFGDGNNSTDASPVHQYTNLGLYTVTLIADAGVCGSDTKVYTDLILVGAETPVATDQESCTPTAFTLNATGSGTISWYDDAAGTNLVGTGTNYTTPTLGSTTSYWVSTSIQEILYGAKPDNTGTGAYFTTAGYPHGLIFDCTAPVVLTSVYVYSSQAGNRTITLETSLGDTLQSAIINIPNGESRITLNFNIPVGTDLKLMGPGAPYLYRNGGTTAPALPYPYYVGDVITIKDNTADNLAYYYYFYDWEIEKVCESALEEVTAYILSTPVPSFTMSNAGNTVTFTNTSTGGNLTYNWDFGDGNFSTEENPVHSYAANGLYTITLTVTNICGTIMYQDQIDLTLTSINEGDIQVVVYPNPAETYCRIQCGEVMKSVELTDIQGKLIQSLIPDADVITLDLQGVAQGIYNIRIVTEKETIVKQIQVK